MKPKSASFITSAADAGGFPRPELPEFAFAGRSNVGKSSLINKLVGVHRLARTSNTPGRTRLINWFRVEPPKAKPMAFVDLPGYGYAKVSQSMRLSWQQLIESYLHDRPVLRAAVVLVDARRGGQAEEADLLEWLAAGNTPAIVVITKADKLPKSKRKPAALAVKKELSLERPPLLFSAHTGDGVDQLWRALLRHL
jgi:GTP-binding protein